MQRKKSNDCNRLGRGFRIRKSNRLMRKKRQRFNDLLVINQDIWIIRIKKLKSTKSNLWVHYLRLNDDESFRLHTMTLFDY